MSELQATSRSTTQRKVVPLGFVRRSEPKPTSVYDTYWKFAAERQAIFHRRARGETGPWTSDPVLRTYKFTNPYRAADRVSQYLISKVIYGKSLSLRDTVLRVLLFKIFNKIETWELLEHFFGEVTEANFDVAQFDQVLSRALEAGATIYSAAYIMPSGPAEIRQPRKHQMHLRLLRSILVDRFPERLGELPDMRAAYELLISLPGIGPFLAYQYATDLNYGDHLSFSESEFVVPGPGARDGMRKCFEHLGGFNEADAIRWVTERQHHEFEKRGLTFENLWGRDLQLIDCQNLFCEVDKYARVVHPEVQGLTGRTRIKQKFAPKLIELSPPWFPPKWNVNSAIGADFSRPLGRLSDIPGYASRR